MLSHYAERKKNVKCFFFCVLFLLGRQRELFNEHYNNNNNNNEVSLCLKYATQFTKAIKRTNSNKLRSVYNRMENKKIYH